MKYRRTGRSGLKLPAISLGLWQNFGGNRDYPSAFEILSYAFDHGITHFDLANNYGPPPGAAEELFGDVMARDFRPYRDELIISTKAGWDMWPGPYGEFGSRKYLIASCDQSLKRMGLDYVDIFYSHRYDPNTPLEETMGALAQLHRQGKALYVGISNYPREQTREAHRILADMGVPLHDPSAELFDPQPLDRGRRDASTPAANSASASSPSRRWRRACCRASTIKGQGRASRRRPAELIARGRWLSPNVLKAVDALGKIAKARKQTMAQLALAWVLRRKEVTSALIGVRTLEQLKDCLGALDNLDFTAKELRAIDSGHRRRAARQHPAA